MKKILFLLTCVLLVGCGTSGETPDPIKIDNKAIFKPYQFDYNGHKYIYFLEYNSSNIVHDPDCSCQKESSYNW